MNRSSVMLTVVIAACATRPDRSLTGTAAARGPSFDVAQYSDWSAPVNLGAPVNTSVIEQGSSLSRDGLSLYFQSTRPGGVGGADIYVAHRACTDVSLGACAWQTPVNLGSTVNTSADETSPRVTIDGHRLFFTSNRPGGFGGQDLYVSRRRDQRDDFSWQTPVNLGGDINTAADDAQPDPFEDEATGANLLYYAVGAGGQDIYVSTLRPDGTYGPGVPVAELNTSVNDRQPDISRDGLEMYFASNRPGTLGMLDLWVATRPSTADPWSTPVNLGSVVNTTDVEARPAISFDGTQLYFQSLRAGGLGNFDLYVTTRTKLEGPD